MSGSSVKLSPEVLISSGGKEYKLVGTIKAIKAIEDSFDMSIGEVLDRCMQMKICEIVSIIRYGIEGTNEKAPANEEIEDVIMDIGYADTKWKVFEFITLFSYSSSYAE